jgi:hypothetical protein
MNLKNKWIVMMEAGNDDGPFYVYERATFPKNQSEIARVNGERNADLIGMAPELLEELQWALIVLKQLTDREDCTRGFKERVERIARLVD